MAAFDDLIPTSFRGVSFPCASVKTQGGHNVVEHKRADRDGAVQENTGRQPNRYELSIPFINGLTKAPQEEWPADLYPDQYRRLLFELEDRSPGTLIHPEFGDRLVTPLSWSTELGPDQRGGVVLQVQFVETLDVSDELQRSIGPQTQTGVAETAADSLVAVYPPAEETAAEYGGLTSWVRDLQKIKGKVAIATNSAAGAINRVVYRLTELADLPDLPAEARIQTYRLTQALRLVADQDAADLNRQTAWYVTPAVCALSQVAQRSGNTVDQIMELNPKLRFAVPAIYRVRYYL